MMIRDFFDNCLFIQDSDGDHNPLTLTEYQEYMLHTLRKTIIELHLSSHISRDGEPPLSSYYKSAFKERLPLWMP
jgi:hypothetical protein